VNRSLPGRIVAVICSVPPFAPVVANGMLSVIGIGFLIARRFAAMRAAGLASTLEGIGEMAGAIAIMVMFSAIFLLMKWMAPAILGHLRLLAIGTVIILASIAVGEIVVLAVLGKSAAFAMLHWTLHSFEIVALFLAGLAMAGLLFWKNIINDTTLTLLQVIGLGLAIAAACAVAAIMATELPIWLLCALGAGVTAAGLWTFWHHRETAYAVTGAFGVLMPLLLLVALQDNSVLFFGWVFGTLIVAVTTTYLREVEPKDDQSCMVALLQYASWIAINGAEAYRFVLH